MTEQTIRQALLAFASNSEVAFIPYSAFLLKISNERLGYLENAAQYNMGFKYYGARFGLADKKKDLHEWTHAISAILRREDLQKPDIRRESCAILINKALIHPLTEEYNTFFISIKKELTVSFGLKRLREKELNSLMKGVLATAPNYSLEEFILRSKKGNPLKLILFSFLSSRVDDKKAFLQSQALQVLKSVDFDPVEIGSWFGEEVKQKVIEINERYKLENLITDEEINGHIKLALIIRGRIANSNFLLKTKKPLEWKAMDYITEQSNLTISGISPDITVSELEKIDAKLLLDYARDGIAVAIENGLDPAIAERIDEVAMFVANTVEGAEIRANKAKRK